MILQFILRMVVLFLQHMLIIFVGLFPSFRLVAIIFFIVIANIVILCILVWIFKKVVM